jgi:hypothetical protein
MIISRQHISAGGKTKMPVFFNPVAADSKLDASLSTLDHI